MGELPRLSFRRELFPPQDPPPHTWVFPGRPPQSRAPAHGCRAPRAGLVPRVPRLLGTGEPGPALAIPVAAPQALMAYASSATGCAGQCLGFLLDTAVRPPEPSTTKALPQNRNEDASALHSGGTWARKTTLVYGDQRHAHSPLPSSKHPGKQQLLESSFSLVEVSSGQQMDFMLAQAEVGHVPPALGSSCPSPAPSQHSVTSSSPRHTWGAGSQV